VQTLNRTIGPLANRHGAAAVVAALTEVMGCSSCMSDVSCGRGIRALMKRIDVIR
jgi:positive regulator of sigma E activity